MGLRKKPSEASETTEPVEIEVTFTVTTDTGQKGDADTYEGAVEVGRELLTANPEASFFGVAKKYIRAT